MTVEVPGEGVYGFASVATDRFGNREREPVPRTRPETVIVVDRTPPQAKWLSPLQNILGQGGGIELAWESSDPYLLPQPVKIQFSADARNNHDRDASWTSLREGLPASGRIDWQPPGGASGRYNFRLIAEDRAGNYTVAYSPAIITVDNTPPVISSVEPLRSNKLEVPIRIEADDGPTGSGVREISLYVSENSGVSWNLLKEGGQAGESGPVKRKSGEPIVFTASRPGDYPLCPVVFDRVGNATPLPSAGVPGPFILTIDNEPPVVSLQNSFLMGRSVILANESRSVSWTAYDPHILDNSAVIELSLDNGGRWQELRSGLPATGSETVYFPFGAISEEAKLRVTVADEFGNIGESQSETFRLSGAETIIDSVTPVQANSPGAFDELLGGDPGPPPRVPPPAPEPPMPGYPQPPPPLLPPTNPFDMGYPPTPPPTGSFGAGYPPIPPPADSSGAGYPPTPILPNDSFNLVYPPGQSGDPEAIRVPPDSFYPPPAAASPYPPDGGYPSGESTAQSLPLAMLGLGARTDSPGQPDPYSPSARLPSPPSSSLEPQASSFDWTPTPGSNSPGAQPPAAANPDQPPPFSGSAPSEGGTGTLRPPPANWETPPAPADSLDFGNLWPDAGTGLTPPPLPGLPTPPGEGGQESPWDNSLFNNLPGNPIPPALPAEPAGPIAPPFPETAGPEPSRPATPLANPPAALPPLPGVTEIPPNIAPPPLSPPAIPVRPDNQRQLSDRHIAESKRLLEEGNLNLAMQEATAALNADEGNYRAYMALSQIYAEQNPEINNFARAATLAKEATNIGRGEWDAWLNCADVFYRWSHRRNLDAQALIREGRRPSVDIIDERNQALSNAAIAIGNSATLAQAAGEPERKKVAVTQGLIAYLKALTISEPAAPPAEAGREALDAHNRELAAYKTAVSPLLVEALPYFQTAMGMGAPGYKETFHLGIINFRLAGLEKSGGNLAQATAYYQQAARYLDEATTVADSPPGGPREAYYMLAYCYDLMAEQPGPGRARNKELALRYWRQTADFYTADSAYRNYAIQRIEALSAEMGR
jgi:hypothetical protein